MQPLAPAPAWPGRFQIKAVQCTLTSGQVGKIVKQIKTDAVALTYGESTAEQKVANYRAIGTLVEGFGFKVSDEHVGQVAALQGKKQGEPLGWQNPTGPREEVKEVKIAHIEEFPSDEAVTLRSHNPQAVSLLARVDGGRFPEAARIDAEIKSDLERPDLSREVASTQGDGEVKPLINTLNDFAAYLTTRDNQANPHHFTVALVGPYGPCDGCKKRITKFIDLWSRKATELMRAGVTAKLTVTYKYREAPQEQHSGQVYGYPEDATQRSPFLHTVISEVKGTNAAR